MNSKLRAGIIFIVFCVVGGFIVGAIGIRGFEANFLPVIFGSVAAYLSLMLSGNRDMKNGSAGDREEALTASPAAGFGHVFVYRNAYIGMAIGMDVSVDGQSLVQLKSPRFTRLVVPAGRHLLSAGMSGFAATQTKENAVPLDILSGQAVFFRLSTKMGTMKNQLLLLAEPDSPGLRQKLRGTTYVMPNGAVPASDSQVPAPPLML